MDLSPAAANLLMAAIDRSERRERFARLQDARAANSSQSEFDKFARTLKP